MGVVWKFLCRFVGRIYLIVDRDVTENKDSAGGGVLCVDYTAAA